ncbi:MAG: glutathione S-transferase family protein [Caulobacteraceae bacterium]|nr:glutathione S-transferase family protein [Caulobacteraceae bacterium]
MTASAGAPVLIGNPVSPYVRKVLVACALKGLEPELDPIVPFMGSDDFTAVSPLRRVPVWIDDQVTLPDSSAILEYLDDRYPDPPLKPDAPGDRARARWLEEYADTRMGDVFIWRLFYQTILRPFVWREETDQAVVAHAREVEGPEIFDYLEGQLPAEGFLFGRLSSADIAIAVHFANARWSRFEPDPARWPRLVAWLEKMDRETPLGPLNRTGSKVLKTPPADHRALLPTLGLGISARTWGGRTARRGVFGI